LQTFASAVIRSVVIDSDFASHKRISLSSPDILQTVQTVTNLAQNLISKMYVKLSLSRQFNFLSVYDKKNTISVSHYLNYSIIQ